MHERTASDPSTVRDDLALTNLFLNPRLRRPPLLSADRAPQDHLELDPGDWVYVHKHARATLVDDGDGQAVRIEGRTDSNDTHISPGGRDGGLRLGMLPGRTYTFAADVELEAPLRGVLHVNALRIVAGWSTQGEPTWNGARSAAAQNVPGRTRLAVTFTVPVDADEAWVRLFGGARKGAVRWSRFQLSEGANGRAFLDAAAAPPDGLTARWRGDPDRSASELYVDRDTLSPGLLDERLAVWLQLEAFEVAARTAGLVVPGSDLTTALGHASNGSWPKVLEAGEIATEEDPKALAPRLLTAAAAVRLKNHEQVVAALAPIFDDPAVDATACYALARAYRLLHRAGETYDVVGAATAKDPRIDAAGATELMAATTNYTSERVAIRAFVGAHLDQIRRMAHAGRAGKTGEMPYVFVYWAQGMEAAPPIVRACYERLRRVPGIDLRLLTEASVPYWVDVPGHIRHRVPTDKAAFADWLRIALLKEYGGIWVDATCYVTGDPSVVDELVGDRRFFAFRYNDARISSWFLAARNNSYIVHMMHAALEIYHRSHDKATHYFFFHDIFEALAQLDDRFGEIWETKGQHRDTRGAHKLQGQLRRPAGTGADLAAIDGSFVHKLTYKLKPHEITPATVAGALVRGDYERHLMSAPEQPKRRRFVIARR
ncbi:capsular polysaccharide synthesis protein [Nocardioides albertanoniae]|uniref:Capsular polysaccharide synthesis protein n=1 Tax=Nocardioides albertanoniae TaxID=1175486 RepID=A0A543A1Y8_9ACTN|nr:capsular polysaccharide synthesis protein [Nocardioides albertanoniae]TQL66593.1 capsular polysaccharide synthesis protein [Nocardioides albertanoniae]